MKFIYINLFALILYSGQIFAQKKNNQVLSVGDILPDFLIRKIIHSQTESINTAEFKDRLLIIDFWSTGCAGCIEALPHMDLLQKKFGSKLKILPVTSEQQDYIVNFWNNNRYTSKLTLPSVVEDKILNSLFPFRYIPHEVWVYKGRVIGITNEEYVDEHNISLVINDEHIDWPVKYDYYKFDYSKPLFNLNPSQINVENTKVAYSAISDYRDGINYLWLTGGSGIQRDSLNKTVRAWFLNQPIFTSYYVNFLMILKSGILIKPNKQIQPNQIIWEVADRSRYKYDKKLGYTVDWVHKNGICFESIYPDTGQSDKDIYASINNDLDRLLGLHVRWEKRKENIMILIKNGKNKIKYKSVIHGKKYGIQTLVFLLNEQEKNPYIFNESGDLTSELELNITSPTDLVSIRNQLRYLGFDLIESQRDVDKMIFTEVDGGRLESDDEGKNKNIMH